MQFTYETTEKGVTERGFELTVDGERVPGILWSPEGAQGARPLLLIGHGGTQHKRIDTILSRARTFVRHHAYAVVAIDAPGHGDRVSPEEAERMRAARRQGRPQMTPERLREMAARNAQAVREWKATLDAVQALDYVGTGPVGYWGVSMGTAIGVPFIASEPRIRAAVLGLAGSRSEEFRETARRITIPIMFMCQWDDEVAPRDSCLALFEAFGSQEKSMHVNPGGHLGIPPFEREYWELFFVRHLGSAREPIGAGR